MRACLPDAAKARPCSAMMLLQVAVRAVDNFAAGLAFVRRLLGGRAGFVPRKWPRFATMPQASKSPSRSIKTCWGFSCCFCWLEPYVFCIEPRMLWGLPTGCNCMSPARLLPKLVHHLPPACSMIAFPIAQPLHCMGKLMEECFMQVKLRSGSQSNMQGYA